MKTDTPGANAAGFVVAASNNNRYSTMTLQWLKYF